MFLKNVVLNYIKEHGSITSMEAYNLGITRLSAVVFVLRNEGNFIDDIWEESTNRYGRKVRYKRYVLRGE